MASQGLLLGTAPSSAPTCESSGPTTSRESSSAMLPRASPLRTDLDLTSVRLPCWLPAGVLPRPLPRLADRFMLPLALQVVKGCKIVEFEKWTDVMPLRAVATWLAVQHGDRLP